MPFTAPWLPFPLSLRDGMVDWYYLEGREGGWVGEVNPPVPCLRPVSTGYRFCYSMGFDQRNHVYVGWYGICCVLCVVFGRCGN
jgi:hypothetical protein